MKNKNTIVTKKQTIFKNEQYEQHTNNGKKQKMKKKNCKLRHNTFEKDLSIIHIMLGAAKECHSRIAPFLHHIYI